MLASIEQHIDWITDCIAYLPSHGLATIEATVAAQDDWVQHVADVGSFTLFPPG